MKTMTESIRDKDAVTQSETKNIIFNASQTNPVTPLTMISYNCKHFKDRPEISFYI